MAHPAVDAVVLRLAVPERCSTSPAALRRAPARPDGYTAQRSYSVASAPGDDLIELFVERIEDGEVSLPRRRRRAATSSRSAGHRALVRLERAHPGRRDRWRQRRGPAGGDVATREDLGHPERLRLAVSATTRARLPYAGELEAAGARIVLTREPGEDHAGRLDPAAIATLVDPEVTVYLCGSARFTGAMETLLVDAGQPAGDHPRGALRPHRMITD